ncbi:MAG: DUF465 domain-containing protein [Alphaproteobacteria bacterium]
MRFASGLERWKVHHRQTGVNDPQKRLGESAADTVNHCVARHPVDAVDDRSILVGRTGYSRKSSQGVMDDDNEAEIKREIEQLTSEHRDLDDVIDRLAAEVPFDTLQVQRLKKRKLRLKDRITYLESFLYPDIIA